MNTPTTEDMLMNSAYQVGVLEAGLRILQGRYDRLLEAASALVTASEPLPELDERFDDMIGTEAAEVFCTALWALESTTTRDW